MMDAAETLGKEVGLQRACKAMEVSRATLYRRHRHPSRDCQPQRPCSPRALSREQRQEVKNTLYSDRFSDKAPREVYATLLDEGQYLCSVRTMYRLLREDQASRERRNQLRHPKYKKPELLASGPNQVWSWDISVPQKRRERWEIWPPAIGLQEQVANHHRRLRLRAVVVSVMEKAPTRCQVWIKKTNASEPLLNCRKR
jgi:hypothetical protein